MITCDYSGIAKHYDSWSMGDDSYVPVADFYLKYFSDYTGVFAELGVGTGRIARPLSKRANVMVYGIDSCEAMLEQCKNKLTADMALKLICSDFTCFKLPQKADIVYMPFRTIGHVLTQSDLNVVFSNINKNLKLNGLFVFDHYIFSKEWAEAHNNIDIPMYENGGVKISDRYIYDFTSKLMHCEVRKNGTTVSEFDFRWIDVAEIEDVYLNCGFSCVSLFGDFDGSVWTSVSPNQIWVLRRSE